MLVECLYHLSHEASMNRLGFLTWCPMWWIFCHSVPDYFVISWYIFLHTFVSVLFFLWIHPPRHVFWWRESRKLLGSTRRSAYLKLLLCAGEVWHTERITLRNTAPEKKRHMTPMRACQPIKYTRNTTVPGMTRVRSKMLPKISINVCSSSRWTSFESRSITCPVVNFSRSALLSCRICQNSYCEIIVLNYYY